MQAKTLIQAKDISFGFNNGLILDGVSLRVKRGEFVGLIGANGTGKTTLLKILGGLLKPTIGSLHLNDIDLSQYSPKETARLIAHVPQTTSIEFALISSAPTSSFKSYPVLISVNLFKLILFVSILL